MLKASDVAFKVSYEPEDLPVSGNCMASGDDAFDAECEKEITDRLRAGKTLAWCMVVVEATFGAWKGRATLGGCSFGSEEDVAACADEHGMRGEALEALNAEIKKSVGSLRAKPTVLGPPWLSEAAEALGEVRPEDGAPLALNWTQVIGAIIELREDRDRWQKRAEKLAETMCAVKD